MPRNLSIKRSRTENTTSKFTLRRAVTLFGCFCLMALVVSCKSRRNAANPNIPTIKFNDLAELVDSNNFKFERIRIKSSAKIKGKSGNSSVKIDFRMVKDSASWVTISKAGIPGATALLTPDSLQAVIKVGDEGYVAERFDELANLYNVDFDYSMLQDAMVGNPAGFGRIEDPQHWIDSTGYVISNLSFRQFNKVMEKGFFEDRFVYRYWINPKNYRVDKVIILDMRDRTELTIRYGEFTEIGGQLLPHQNDITISNSLDSLVLNLKYSRIKYNQPFGMPFSIPEDFQQIPLIPHDENGN